MTVFVSKTNDVPFVTALPPVQMPDRNIPMARQAPEPAKPLAPIVQSTFAASDGQPAVVSNPVAQAAATYSIPDSPSGAAFPQIAAAAKSDLPLAQYRAAQAYDAASHVSLPA